LSLFTPAASHRDSFARAPRTATPGPTPPVGADQRPQVRGKFLYLGDSKFYICGVTYGAFRPDDQGEDYRNFPQIDRDFAHMAAAGINTVRIYTLPPREVLDLAHRHGLKVMVGLAADQYVGYLVDTHGAPDIAAIIRDKVRSVAGHPALLCYALGNEISPQLVRFLGRHTIERYLKTLYHVVKREDPQGLVTYVNFPTTEYLDLPFLDLVCFNVYLENRDRLDAYLARLHSIAVERPLILSEVGLDSIRNGTDRQAQILEWQIRATFAAGCAGTFIFAWTDEWFTGGDDVHDWDFGLTDRQRRPKPALAAVSRAYAEVPFPEAQEWPRISVVVCTHNGSRTIRDTLKGLRDIDYGDFEVIVVDDGSTDATAEIVRRYKVKLISTENRGLSAARNTGWQNATGEIVAYIDDDAYPDPHWLRYLAHAFRSTSYKAIGGPNFPPPGDGLIADCVAQAPGGPTHVLLTDTDAEHIPGCNMAFRRDTLAAIGGFDPRYRVAGDDVHACWRILQCQWKIGFHPAAVVWHHRRNSVRAYWRQQKGYGKAEALLEAQWPEKYNSAGHLMWAGRVYTSAKNFLFLGRGRVYPGTWGSAPFQSLYQPAAGLWGSLPLMPEWYLIMLVLAGFTLLGFAWTPMFLAAIPLALSIAASLGQAIRAAATARFGTSGADLRRRLLTGFLFLLQPLARLVGRVRFGLTPWRHRLPLRVVLPTARRVRFVRKNHWQSAHDTLLTMERFLLESSASVQRGADYDDWDLHIHGGLLGGARATLAVEDCDRTTQLIRLPVRPVFARPGLLLAGLFGTLAAAALHFGHSWTVTAILGGFSAFLLLRAATEAASSLGAALQAIRMQQGETGT
jgi:glycosyltransferase involved in cell wall biosynthesis